MPQLDGTVPSTRVAVIEVSVGLMDAGTYSVTVDVVEPIRVFPLYVAHVRVQVPLVLLGT